MEPLPFCSIRQLAYFERVERDSLCKILLLSFKVTIIYLSNSCTSTFTNINSLFSFDKLNCSDANTVSKQVTFQPCSISSRKSLVAGHRVGRALRHALRLLGGPLLGPRPPPGDFSPELGDARVEHRDRPAHVRPRPHVVVPARVD